MAYSVIFTEQAIKELKKLDQPIRKLIFGWIEKNLSNCENQRLHGKALTGDKKNLWRYKASDYRIIAEIREGEFVIEVITIGHRKEVYRK